MMNFLSYFMAGVSLGTVLCGVIIGNYEVRLELFPFAAWAAAIAVFLKSR